MRPLSLHLLGPFLQVCRAAYSSPHDPPPSGPPEAAQPEQHVLSQHDPDPVPDLISFQSNLQARGFAALGDSYSAGIGTGTDPDLLPSEGECRRGQHGYPLLLHADLNNRTGTNTTLQWLSCTGAGTTDLLSDGSSGAATTTAKPPSQLDALDTTLPLDFATLSVGGNDLGFFDVMNACIFRFYGWNSGTCAAALAAAEAALQPGAALDRRLALLLVEVLDRVRWERRPGFTLTVTGYARFFDDTTPDCDHMSLAVWTGGRRPFGGPRLSRDLRARLNALVLAANARLAAAVRATNARFRDDGDREDRHPHHLHHHPRVLFVDYDDAFRGHRFCEPGVVEPAYDRDDTWFFLVGGLDNDAAAGDAATAPNQTSSSSSPPSPPGASPPGALWGNDDDDDGDQQQHPLPRTVDHHHLVEPEACLEPARRRGDWGELALCHMATARARDPSLRPAYRGAVAENSMWGVPTYYGKTFHPRSRGCEAIRDRIYETWARYGLL